MGALRRRLGRGLDRGADLLGLEVVSLRVDLGEVREVLGIAGLDVALNPRTLIGVIALAGYRERLVGAARLAFLLGLLDDLKNPAATVVVVAVVMPVAVVIVIAVVFIVIIVVVPWLVLVV